MCGNCTGRAFVLRTRDDPGIGAAGPLWHHRHRSVKRISAALYTLLQRNIDGEPRGYFTYGKTLCEAYHRMEAVEHFAQADCAGYPANRQANLVG